jgi:hypothetical protein
MLGLDPRLKHSEVTNSDGVNFFDTRQLLWSSSFQNPSKFCIAFQWGAKIFLGGDHD